MKINVLSWKQSRKRHMQKSFFQHKDAHDCPHRDTPCLPLFLITISSFCGYRSMTALFYRNVFLSINLFHLIAPIPIYLKLVIALAIFQIFVSFPNFLSHSWDSYVLFSQQVHQILEFIRMSPEWFLLISATNL